MGGSTGVPSECFFRVALTYAEHLQTPVNPGCCYCRNVVGFLLSAAPWTANTARVKAVCLYNRNIITQSVRNKSLICRSPVHVIRTVVFPQWNCGARFSGRDRVPAAGFKRTPIICSSSNGADDQVGRESIKGRTPQLIALIRCFCPPAW